jgi:hypothetical protein
MAEELILHEEDVRAVIEEEITEEIASGATVVSPTAPSGTYVQAEAVSAKDAIDDIIAALVEVGILVEDV